MEVVLIAAVAANGVIGSDGTLPWHLPEDLAHFKDTTMGHPVIMGRVAFEDILGHIGEPLPGRTNIVLSRSARSVPAGVTVVNGIDESLEAARETGSAEVYVAGGATVYEQFLPLADRMILTELDEPHEGDVTFPEFDRDEWTVSDRDRRSAFTIVAYER